VKFAGNFFAKKFPPKPPSRNSYHLWLTDFLAEEIGKPEHIEKFLERGAGEEPFFKKGLPRLLP
jgi:hypothetical protein